MTILLLYEAMKRSNQTDLEFFQTCYMWRFGKQVDVFGDVLAWRVQKIIPSYVKEFLANEFK